MSDYQIERRQLAVCAQERSMPRYKRNKNKATPLRIRSRTRSLRRLPGQFFFSIHRQSGRALSRNASKTERDFSSRRLLSCRSARRRDRYLYSKSVPAILITNLTTCSNVEFYSWKCHIRIVDADERIVFDGNCTTKIG